jgi:hypothetical protein
MKEKLVNMSLYFLFVLHNHFNRNTKNMIDFYNILASFLNSTKNEMPEGISFLYYFT